MADHFKSMARSITAPALGSLAITPSDSTNLGAPIRAITLNVGGTLAWLNEEGTAQATALLPAGTYPLIATRILATGTTATGLTGWI
ncbi:MAG TPA: hypothetical protein PLH11_03590 [Gemmobacter sp.]|mgnify:CR=1 FL=1|nr:hypothetical protein [Gemmobacter sp.]